MIDYLELLLDMWQEEDETEPFTWKRAGTGYRGLDGEDGVRQAEGREKAVTELAGGPGRVESLWEKATRETNRAADPEARLAMLERTVARGKTQQTARGRSWERTDTAQAADGWDARRMNAAAPGVQRGLAGLLDVAFERDARRYDGPLGLF